jgi:hypothetical protein
MFWFYLLLLTNIYNSVSTSLILELTMLSELHSLCSANGEMLYKEVSMSCFKGPFKHLPGGT